MVSLVQLLKCLDSSRYSARVICLQYSYAVDALQQMSMPVQVFDRYRKFTHTNINWIRWYQPWRLIKTFYHLWRTSSSYAYKILSEEKPDLVHLNADALIGWAIAARRLDIPIVLHLRNSIAQGYFGLRRKWIRSVVNSCVDHVIAISEENASRLGLPEKTSVIFNFVDPNEFNPEIEPIRIPESAVNKKVVLYLGGALEYKGFSVLVRALPLLNEDIVVVFAGYYPQESRKLRKLVKSVLWPGHMAAVRALKSARNAINIGRRTDIPQCLAACDVLVSPSTIPHFARPVIEAGAMKKPVIASAVDGMDELVIHGKTGELVPPGDHRALADTINRLCSDDILCENMGLNGYSRAMRLFNSFHNARATVEVYEHVFSQR